MTETISIEEVNCESDTTDEKAAQTVSLCAAALRELSAARQNMQSVQVHLDCVDDKLQSLLAVARVLSRNVECKEKIAHAVVDGDAGSIPKSGAFLPPWTQGAAVHSHFKRNLIRPPSFPTTDKELPQQLDEQISVEHQSRQVSSDRSSSIGSGSTYRSGTSCNQSRSPSNRGSSIASTTRHSSEVRMERTEDSLQCVLASARALSADVQQCRDKSAHTVADRDAGSIPKSGAFLPPWTQGAAVHSHFKRNLIRPPSFPTTDKELPQQLDEEISVEHQSRQVSSDRGSSVGSTYRSGSFSNRSGSPSNRGSSIGSTTRISFDGIQEPCEEPEDSKAFEDGSSPLLMEQHELFIEGFYEELSTGRPILLSMVNNLFRMRCGRELQYKPYGYRKLRDFLADIPGLEVAEDKQMNVRLGEPTQFEAYRHTLADRRELIDAQKGHKTLPHFQHPVPPPYALQEQVRKLFLGMEGSRVPLREFMKAWCTIYPNEHLAYRKFGYRDVRSFLSSLPFLDKLGSKGDTTYCLKEATTQKNVGDLSVASAGCDGSVECPSRAIVPPWSRSEYPHSRSRSLSPARSRFADHDSFARSPFAVNIAFGDGIRAPSALSTRWRPPLACGTAQVSGQSRTPKAPLADPMVAQSAAPQGVTIGQEEPKVARHIPLLDSSATVSTSLNFAGCMRPTAQEYECPHKVLLSGAKRTYFVSPAALEPAGCTSVDVHNMLNTKVHANQACMVCSFSTGQVLIANGCCRDFLGGRGMHIVRRSFLSLVHKDDRDSAMQLFSHLTSNKRTEIVEPLRLRLVHSTGRVLPTCITGKCLSGSWWLMVLQSG